MRQLRLTDRLFFVYAASLADSGTVLSARTLGGSRASLAVVGRTAGLGRLIIGAAALFRRMVIDL